MCVLICGLKEHDTRSKYMNFIKYLTLVQVTFFFCLFVICNLLILDTYINLCRINSPSHSVKKNII